MPSFRPASKPTSWPTSWIVLVLLLLSPGIVRAQTNPYCDDVYDTIAVFLFQHAHSNPHVQVQASPTGLYRWVTLSYTDGGAIEEETITLPVECDELPQYVQPPPEEDGFARRAAIRASSSAVAPVVPYGTAAGTAIIYDFNSAGQPDVAVLNSNINAVGVFLGASTVSSTPAKYEVGNNPSVIASGDFNGDGIVDLAIANYGDSTVSILLGSKDGTFQTAKTYPAGVAGEALATGDVNGDGKLDLVVANYGQPQAGSNGKFVGGSITVLLGGANGSFGAPSTVGQGAPLSLVLADFNHDGNPDIAYGDYNLRSIVVLHGNGKGAFGAAVNTATSDQPDFLGYGDFNGDGIEDMAVLSSEAKSPPFCQKYMEGFASGWRT